MAIITTGNNFGATDAVTNTKLNNIANAATFDDPADETSIEKITSGAGLIGKLGIKDGGVTKTKIENVANLRVLGNTSGSPTAPQEVEILDDDTMDTADAATLATSESIKAYVDNLPGIKAHCFWDGTATGTNAPISGSGVTSVTRNATGSWTINFSVTAPSASFTVLASSDPVSGGTVNYSTGASPSSTTQALVRRERADGPPHDNAQMSFAAIW